LRKPDGKEAHRHTADISQHMAGIGQERQAAGPQPSYYFQDQKATVEG